jgi:hypothetical protein
MTIPILPEEVTLVAAVKYLDKEKILNIVNEGIRDIGFNTVQQLEEIAPALDNKVRIHFIGHLQKNKIKRLLKFKPYLIQSCDSYKLIEKINSVAEQMGIIQNILLQIKTDEEKEYGFSFEEIENTKQLPNIKIRGIMTIPSKNSNVESFKKMKATFDNMQEESTRRIDYLSMGMSGDYELAIKEGANMVRLGRILS